jgi:hypothetical protein
MESLKVQMMAEFIAQGAEEGKGTAREAYLSR